MQAPGETSEFNMAVSFLNTLRTLLNLADDSAINLNIYNWFHVLLSLRRELCDEMNDEQIKKSNKFRDDLAEKVNMWTTTRNNKGLVTQQLYNSLDEFELFLRKIITEKGYKNRMLDSPSKALRGN